MHPSNPQKHRYSIYPVNLPEPLFHPYQIPASSTIPNTHHASQHTPVYTIRQSPSPLHSKLQPIYHTTYHPNQFTKLSQIPHNLHLSQLPKLPILTNNGNSHLSTPHNYHNTLPTTHVTNTTKISTHYSADITKQTP